MHGQNKLKLSLTQQLFRALLQIANYFLLSYEQARSLILSGSDVKV